MRWFALITTFMVVAFISFLFFIWASRTELASRCFDMSLEETNTEVESISALSFHSLALKNVEISQDTVLAANESMKIEQLVLEIRPSELLSWCLLPLKSPLTIESATIVVQNPEVAFTPSSRQPILFIRKVEVVLPNGQCITLGEQTGTPGSILVDVMKAIQGN